MKQTAALYKIFLILLLARTGTAQTTLQFKDSIEVRANLMYDMVSSTHRALFGENYRKEWAAATKLPIIKLSQIRGGLYPTKAGGGHQSRSLRLKDSSGTEWVLRSVNKSAGKLSPDMLQGSVYEEWLEDNFSAQHPYSALIVPVLAKAVKVPHTNPVIGWVVPDNILGKYEKDFAGTLCLLEEREPEGDSDDTPSMLSNLEKDNNNRLDSVTFFKARLLDLLVADWGRHADQWRWVDKNDDEGIKGINYLTVPRDRDQVFYVNEGIISRRASGLAPLAFLEGFNKEFKNVNTALLNGGTLNQQFLNQFSYQDWMQLTREFITALPDSILEKAIERLPESSRRLRGEVLLNKLKSRRDNMIPAMDTYYRFLYHIVDIRTSDRNEWIDIDDHPGGALSVAISKGNAMGSKGEIIFHNVFKPDVTREVRLFVGKGEDRIHINTPETKIKLRIIGGEGQKTYDVKSSGRKIHVYEDRADDVFIDPGKDLFRHLSNDTLNVKKEFTNLYPNSGLSPAVGFRSDDGLLLGLSYKLENEGFRKKPYGNVQKFTALKSLTTKTVRFKYEAEWLKIAKKTDFLINGFADVPSNRFNFFGRGNETLFNDQGDFRDFYRVTFNFFTIEPAFRYRSGRHLTFNAGPSYQYSKLKTKDNTGRFIKLPELAETYIGTNLTREKAHGGAFFKLDYDTRDSEMFPTKGLHWSIRLHAYEGLNKYSDDFIQALPQMSFYKALNKNASIVLANRSGGTLTKGQTTFYQSAFLGGHDNLQGYLKFRFAGDHAVYNNLELRINLPNFLHYTLPGKFGLIAFYDVGRVWIKGEDSQKYHHGTGGGIYIAPFKRFLARGILGYSEEGFFPNVSFGHRF